MKNENILISIVMPTLNAEEKIKVALESIRSQNIDQEKIEILVIDGGSTDKTQEIALQYKAEILKNDKVVPEAAKHIGTMNANGKYIVYMDSDEEFTNNNQLQNRIKLFIANPKVKAIMPNTLRNPKGYARLSRYVNAFGDPFSRFIYNLDSENLVQSLDAKNYKYKKDNLQRVYYFNQGDILPIGDGGTVMFDLEYIRDNFTDRLDSNEFIASIFYEVVSKTNCMGVIEDDIIDHYSSSEFKTHLKKLKFRVVNNVHTDDSYAGFAARNVISKRLKIRKYLYIVYCCIVPWVVLDSIILAVKKQDSVFLLNFIFAYYVFFQIIYQMVLKLLGRKIKSVKYGA